MPAAEDLKYAIERGQMTTVYQPIVHLGTGEIAGFECLPRWNHPLCGWLAPSLFVPIAEETGAIVQIGGWMSGRRAGFSKTSRSGFPHSLPHHERQPFSQTIGR